MPRGRRRAAPLRLEGALLLAGSAAAEDNVVSLRERIADLESENRRLREELLAKRPQDEEGGLLEYNGGVFNIIQVAHLPFHKNFRHLPTKPTAFWLEVGTNSRDLLSDFAEVEAFSRGAFLLSFEPLLDKYAFVLNRKGGGQAEVMHSLGRQHEQAMVFPMAVGCTGSAKLFVTKSDGCSSLYLPRGDNFAKDPGSSAWRDWVGQACVQVADTRHVPCISLEHIIGEWLNASDVEYLKIDAQGADLAIVQSAGRFMEHLKAVTMEVTCDSVARLYEGTANCTDIYKEMRSMGFYHAYQEQCTPFACASGQKGRCRNCIMVRFYPASCKACQRPQVEVDITFLRRSASLPVHLITKRTYPW